MGTRTLQQRISKIRVGGATAAFTLVVVLGLGIIQSAQAQTFSVLHSFTGGPDGASPTESLVRDLSGNLYGTTENGGAYGWGTAFKVDATGKETVLHSFANFFGNDGASPTAGLLRGAQGNLYGTTFFGGAYGAGTVFKLSKTGTETILYTFQGKLDGAGPYGGVIHDAAGNLYGTTYYGGNLACNPTGFGCGTVFKVDTIGSETVLYSFTGAGGDGANPYAVVLLRDAQGNLYGTTLNGGAFGYGTVFKVDTTGKETVLHSFTGTGGDGSYPGAGLVRYAGYLYGTTSSGGAGGWGTVFKMNTSGKETVLYSFTGLGGDGANPGSGLVRDANGNLYGTTVLGGGGYGTVFKLDTTGKETVLHSFTGLDGERPSAGVIRDSAGNLYGAAAQGGASGYGTVFKLTP